MIVEITAVCVALIHTVAIVLGRKTDTKLRRVAFVSGMAGLASFPVVFYFILKSFCIAGMCRGVDMMASYAAVATFGGLSLMSAGAVVALIVHRARA